MKADAWFLHSGPLEDSQVCPEGVWEECYKETEGAVPFVKHERLAAAAIALRIALEYMDGVVLPFRSGQGERYDSVLADRIRLADVIAILEVAP